MIVTKGTTRTLTLAAGNTEYSLALPSAARLVVQARAADVRLAWEPGKVADGLGEHFTVKAAQPPRTIDTIGGVALTLYAASTTAGAVLEVEVWA